MSATEPRAACLDPDTLAAYVDGLLAADAIRAADQHIDRCSACRHELSALAVAQTHPVLSIGRGAPLGAETHDPSVGDLTVGRYVVMRELGRGGMGIVVRAYDPVLARGVAIKLLHPGTAGDRVRDEARAMAQLTHPNVVTVYDVIGDGDSVYIAMELVDGDTLRDRLRTPQRWRDTLALCVRAGRGLAAAHAANLVHRDFKPENVLCSGDGRVLVSDFGLSHQADVEDAEAPSGGTPAYLAPEVFRGEPATAASDQFSFCVTVYEALHGARPFAGASRAEQRAASLAAVVPPAPADSAVPRWVRAALVRGLARAPAERFDSMTALLDALERDPSAGRRRAAPVIGVGVLAAAIGAIAVAAGAPGQAGAPRCAIDASALGDAWTPTRRGALDRAFAAVGGADIATRVDRAIDDYAADWVAVRREACAATRVRGEQSQQVLDDRVACLDRGQRELAELTALFGAATGTTTANAVDAVYRLQSPAACTAAAVHGASGHAWWVSAAIDVQRADLDRAWAMFNAGKPADADAIAARIARSSGAPAATASALDDAGLVAEGWLLRGRAATALTRFDDADRDLYLGLDAAERAHDDSLVARIWIELVDAASAALKPDLAIADTKATDAALARITPTPELRARYDYTTASALRANNDVDGARARFEQALAAATHDGDRGVAHAALCDVLAKARKFDLARTHCEQALVLLTTAYGRADPRCAFALVSLAGLDRNQRDWAAARRRLLEAIAILEGAHRTEDVIYARALYTLGMTYGEQDDDVHARRYYERARDLYAQYHPTYPGRLLALEGLAAVAMNLGDPARAVATYREALAITETSFAPDSAEHLTVLYDLTLVYRANHQPAEQAAAADKLLELAGKPGHESWEWLGSGFEAKALVFGDRGLRAQSVAMRELALTAFDKADDPQSRAFSEGAMGGDLEELRQHQRALDHLTRALAFYAADPSANYERGAMRAALAHAHWNVGDHKAAIADALLARAELATANAGPDLAGVKGDLDAWMREHHIRF